MSAETAMTTQDGRVAIGQLPRDEFDALIATIALWLHPADGRSVAVVVDQSGYTVCVRLPDGRSGVETDLHPARALFGALDRLRPPRKPRRPPIDIGDRVRMRAMMSSPGLQVRVHESARHTGRVTAVQTDGCLVVRWDNGSETRVRRTMIQREEQP